jgi:N-acetylmuramoyl-L-alanine amidase
VTIELERRDPSTDAAHEELIREQQAAKDRARAVFGGLAPRQRVRQPLDADPVAAPSSLAASRARSAAMNTMPLVLTGALALGLGIGTVHSPVHATPRKPLGLKPQSALAPSTLRAALDHVGAAITPGAASARALSTTVTPTLYTVEAGDTVSFIAARFGLSTAGVLALNGLSWKSTIFPGQVLKLTNSPTKSGSPASPLAGGVYQVRTGDTVSAIAARFGVSTQSILDANGLSWKSIIYPGQTLLIPGTETGPVQPIADQSDDPSFDVASMAIAERPVLPGGPAADASPGVTSLGSEARAHAATIIAVGRSLGVPDYGIVIALATAMQESSMRNLSWGDRDSVGLFQQRPSTGWGTPEQLQDPAHAARLFYLGNPGLANGLLDIHGWQSMSLTEAAQAVQISAHPDAYARWHDSAWVWLYELS